MLSGKPDGTAGFYDALPNNSPAITISGNTVTVELVEQVLTVAGCVHCEINMYNAASEKLTTFTFEISVEESVLTDAEIISSDYYNVLTAEIAKALQAVTDATEQAENAAQSAQDAADSAAMSKDWAAGQSVTYSGAPVFIAYAGANRIASITAYGETTQGGTTEAPVALTGISSVTVNDDVTELPIPRPLHKVGDVRDVCVTRVKSIYDKRIVLDGSENWTARSNTSHSFVVGLSVRSLKGLSDSYYSMRVNDIDVINGVYLLNTSSITITDLAYSTVEEFKAHLSEHPLTVYYQSAAYDGTNGLDVCLTEYQTGYIESYADESITTAWISSMGALSTGAEVAYVLSSPETYATDPVDFDNAAGPLTVMTGGEVEVRMTDLIGSRSDVSNNTVAFSEAAQDADIQTEETLSTLFGKIKKRLSVITTTFAKLSNLAYGNEVDTGLTWLDGKKIYRKTAKITPSQYAVLEEGDPVTYTATVENWMVGINEICMLQGMLVNLEGYYLPLGAKRNGNNDYGGYIAASIENNIVKLTIGTGARPLAASNISHFTVICEYTKI